MTHALAFPPSASVPSRQRKAVLTPSPVSFSAATVSLLSAGPTHFPLPGALCPAWPPAGPNQRQQPRARQFISSSPWSTAQSSCRMADAA